MPFGFEELLLADLDLCAPLARANAAALRRNTPGRQESKMSEKIMVEGIGFVTRLGLHLPSLCQGAIPLEGFHELAGRTAGIAPEQGAVPAQRIEAVSRGGDEPVGAQ